MIPAATVAAAAAAGTESLRQLLAFDPAQHPIALQVRETQSDCRSKRG
jgi:hypothetical protein